ncbi:MAG: succinylglutamate desuccinylase [Alphaproteobacteria bacterium]|nr:succinylglutamate desuccinylase [Alphaproteobacteria bacterium]
MARAIYGPWHDLDLETDGKRLGHLNLPITTSRSGYGNIMVPIVVIRRGNGPLALLMGGNHGDEFEGQVALAKIARLIEPQHITGTIVIMATANLPAAIASNRVSPVDDGNLNSAFPGRVDGNPTSQLAYFVNTEILPRAALWIDIHSGGTSLIYTPMAAIHHSEDPALNASAIGLLRAFGAPTNAVFVLQHEYAASSEAQRHHVPYIYGEFGGAATVGAAGLRAAHDGTLRALAKLGVLRADSGLVPQATEPGPLYSTAVGTTYRETRRNYAFAPITGVFEPAFTLGQRVAAGDLVGHVHPVETPLQPPVAIRFGMGGVVLAMRHLARVEPGDCLAQLGFDRSWDAR